MTCYFGAEQAGYFTMYKHFFENYDDVDIACDLTDEISTSSIVITTNKVAIYWEFSKQSEPTGATTSAELCSADKGIIKSVDIRYYSDSTAYPICDLTTVYKDNTNAVKAISSDCISPTHIHYDVRIHRVLHCKQTGYFFMVLYQSDLMLANPNTKPYGGNNLKTKIDCFIGVKYYSTRH
eukprot:15365163-Ditylum_brightwellii.AAC.1